MNKIEGKRLCSPIKDSGNEVIAKKQKLSLNNGVLADTIGKEEFDFEDFDLADFSELDFVEEVVKQKLDLSKWQRCVVDAVERERRSFDLVLTVSAADAGGNKENLTTAKCHLQGPWSHTRIEVGDVVSLLCVWDDQQRTYKVNKDHGFCVTNPDTLISGTTVVGSLFCRRKAVLQEMFKGIDASNKVMVIGSLVHELLQIVLSKGLSTNKEIQAVAEELLQSPQTAFMLYGNLLTREEVKIELQNFLPNIFGFVNQYISGRESKMRSENFTGTITKVQDIEENVWVPQLGLKGKIDVSVHVKRRYNAINSKTLNSKAIPLELKTGRASFSLEHKGQLILYQMMLSAVGEETSSGLLLYLREGVMREISGARNEQRDLIVLRNELAHYLSRTTDLPARDVPLNLAEDKFIQPIELPEPISHPIACSKCEYATLCCSFAKTDANLQLRESHPLKKIMADVTEHLSVQDYEYFIRWCILLSLEEQEAKKSNYLKSLWTETPEIRELNGRAVTDLEVLTDVKLIDSRYQHTFGFRNVEQSPNEIDLKLCGFSIGEYVIVSTRKRLAVAAGCVCDLTKSQISISLERNLQNNYKGQKFIVDKHDSQSGNIFNFTNLGLLLDNNERATELRSIIIHREPPLFEEVLPKVIATKGAGILEALNSKQRTAVLKALRTQNFMLIKGLPGTGKTQTLVALIRLLYLMGKSVLITSHTHSAVDNLLLRLKSFQVPLLRLGSAARVNPQLKECSEGEVTKDCHTEDELERKYMAYNIVGVTCLGSAHSIFLHRKFDVCIVDEATQVMQPTVIRPLFFCKKFILVGDPDQLPPLIRSKEARLRGADESLFLRLDSDQATVVLTLQYRMNKTITKLANELTYGGALQCATKEVHSAVVKLPTSAMVGAEKWLQRTLQSHVDQAIFLLDTGNCAERSYQFASTKHSEVCAAIEQTYAEDTAINDNGCGSPNKKRSIRKRRVSKYTNYCEAAIVFDILKLLLRAGYDCDRIGVIAPYRAQVELLRKLAAEYQSFFASQMPALNFASVEVNTVDQYQGRDKDIILYSCAKTGPINAHDIERSREAEILEDKRRLTVAITRSKMKLILVGDSNCLQQYTPFRRLIQHIPSYCKLQLEDDKQGFNWQKLFEELTQVLDA